MRTVYLQFSARTLLLITAVLCIVLGVYFDKGRRQAVVLRRLRAARGSVQVTYWGRDGMIARDRDDAARSGWLPLPWEYRVRVQGITLDESNFDAWSRLKDLRGLARIYIVRCKTFDDESARSIAQIESVEGLVIENTSITSNAMASLAAMPRLKRLSLFSDSFDSTWAPHIAKLKQLKELFLAYPDEVVLKQIQDAMPHCTVAYYGG